MKLIEKQILELSKQAEEAKKAQELALPSSWIHLEVVPGKGLRGLQPNRCYYTWVTLEEIESIRDSDGEVRKLPNFSSLSYVCACESLNRPCKHVLALLLLFNESPALFSISQFTPYLAKVSDFITIPDTKDIDKEVSQNLPDKEPLVKIRAKNINKRIGMMSIGLEQLEAWILDLLRTGVAGIEGNSKEFLQTQSVRLVDAKLGSLARRVRILADNLEDGNWYEKIAEELGELYLHLKGFQNIQTLPPGLQDDLLSMAGVYSRKAEILNSEYINDRWFYAGCYFTQEENNLFSKRSWFWGEKSAKPLMILDFFSGYLQNGETSYPFFSEKFAHLYPFGLSFEGEAVYYPSASPKRGLFKTAELSVKAVQLKFGYNTIEEFAEAYSETLAQNPWILPFPAIVKNVIPLFHCQDFILVDNNKNQLKLNIVEDLGWHLIAMAKGKQINVFGIWDGLRLRALCAQIPHNASPFFTRRYLF